MADAFTHTDLPHLRKRVLENLDALEDGRLSPDEEARVRDYGRQVKARRRLPYL